MRARRRSLRPRSTADALDALLRAAELHDVRAAERMVGLVERGTALSPAQLSRWLEHIVDDGSEDASFQLALFKVIATLRNLLKAEQLLRQLDTDGHPKAALQLVLLLHTIKDSPNGDRAVIKLFTEAAARGDADAVNNCAIFHALGVAKNVARAFALFWTLGFDLLPLPMSALSGPRPARRRRSFRRNKAFLNKNTLLIGHFPFSIPKDLV